MKKQFFTQFLGGICGGVILGIFLFVTLMEYGGRNGCFPFIDKMFHDVGYLSCGSFGLFFGIVLGSLIGIFSTRKIKITDKNFSKIIKWICFFTIIVPFLYGTLYGQLRDSISEIFLVFGTISVFIVCAAFFSILFTSILNWRMLRR